MAEIPEKIQVGPTTYKVDSTAEGILRYEMDSATPIGGSCNHSEALIHISPVVPPSRRRVNLTHEFIHALIDEWHLREVFRDDCMESFITRFSPALLDLLRRNPQLVAFLVSEAEDG